MTARFNPRVLLFDMDGTLVDSTAVVERTWRDFAARHGLDAADILADSHGRRGGETVARHLPAGADVAAETARVDEQELRDLDGVVAIPGAAELLAGLPAGSWALVTSAGPELAARRMAAVGLPMPDVVVTGEDVRRGKPDPEGYLRAAAALGVPATEALIFEDAEAGIEAARAAGGRVVVVGFRTGPATSGLPRIADFTGVRADSAESGLTVELRAPADEEAARR
ncbi:MULTISPECIES: HAD-IA family hydrolase [unclassified Saccharopolyspora]|uniref:HAD-IA family hydrolase n=1 Tax=unclassified Saccharopolyspora TaxID=2646250 RepID=UPI001CD6BDFD|nr:MULTISPECIES: HAD-IA family hydrolase [unclassified Saccharopolyspora]MCA1189010.1 HAD-IA family hydrolase [Saccharopolyspora sp. 6T]MCA1191212.1 HAD-IA family hydrolase [Saccharopolyspora sp. 6V]MCA1228899.1 HAD-IA family hydrolase [Saccharopolyspora sp. 6M]MCA1281916.1 HAD-IA family hydrolase [Saccharopolyspora sp. 7B]